MKIIIANSSDTPIYEQIAEAVQKGIISGELSESDELPSIRALARELSVSVITVKNAYETLEEKGYIITRPGRGSVVSTKSNVLALEHKISEMEQHLLSAIDISRGLDMEFTELLRRLEELSKEI